MSAGVCLTVCAGLSGELEGSLQGLSRLKVLDLSRNRLVRVWEAHQGPCSGPFRTVWGPNLALLPTA